MSDLVSCLCASKPSRWGNLQRAVLDFDRQTHGRRELIIVVGDASYAGTIESYLDQLPDTGSTIKLYHRAAAKTAQDCYWHALTMARGDLITFWDDEDQNHPERLARQAEEQKKFPDSLTALSRGLYHFFETNELYVVDFVQPGAYNSEKCCVGTLMSPRDALPPLDGSLRVNMLVQLADSLKTRWNRKLAVLASDPYRHVVGVAGDNARTADAHRRLATQLPGCKNVAWLEKNKAEVVAGLDGLFFDTTLHVSGPDGTAFDYTPKQVWPADLYPIVIPAGAAERVAEKVEE